MKTIVLDLSSESCADAIEYLKRYQKEIKPKMEEVCKRLAEIGLQEALAHLVKDGGNTNAKIFTVPIEGGYKIVMEGKDVYFIEFGTGSDVDAHYENTSVPVFSGSWSMEHSQMYARQGFWWYGGEIYTGTPAYMPMYYAGKKIRDEIPRIAKEVFGK